MKSARQASSLRSDTGERWKCDVCGRWRFPTWWAIYQHFKSVHPHIPKKDILGNTLLITNDPNKAVEYRKGTKILNRAKVGF